MGTVLSVVDTDVTNIENELVAKYETLSNTSVPPASVAKILLSTNAYGLSLLAEQLQAAFDQVLVVSATGAHLEALGALVGVTRLGQRAATCTLRFNLVIGHGGVIIPAGTRIASVDTTVVFSTQQAVSVPSGTNQVDIPAVCTTLGTIGNNYAAGTINNNLDPLSFVSTANPPFNVNVTAGGANTETDDALRQRIFLAPSSFSVAGPAGAYKYWARTAHPSIVDVGIVEPPNTPGQVHLYVLVESGQTTPAQILTTVYNTIYPHRPMCDTVIVNSAVRMNYTLSVNLTLYDTADPSIVVPAVRAALQSFVDEKRKTLGRDIVFSQIVRVAQIDGVYSVDLPSFSDIIVSPTEFPYCTALNVQSVGTTAG